MELLSFLVVCQLWWDGSELRDSVFFPEYTINEHLEVEKPMKKLNLNFMRLTKYGSMIGKAAIAGAIAVTATAGAAQAEWPVKPIKLVVPFGAGGGSDTSARIYQKAIQDNKILSQPLTVINVPGAGGSIGARQVKDAKADGYTFLLIHVALLSRQAAGLIDFGYQDFELIAGTEVNNSVLAVPANSRFKTLADLVAEGKSSPNKIVFGVNLGANKHMEGILLEQKSGSKFRFAQIGGDAKNVAALKGGIIDVAPLSVGSFNSLGGGSFRALAIYAPKRHPNAKDIPTFVEQGYDVTYTVQNFWFAPKGTPKEAINGFAAALKKAGETSYAKTSFAKRNSATQYVTGGAFAKLVSSTYKQIEPLAQIAAKAKKKKK